MAVPARRDARNLCEFIAHDLSLWQAFLLLLWLSVFVVHQLSSAVLGFLEQWFLDAFVEDEAASSEQAVGEGECSDVPVDECRGESSAVSLHGQTNSGEGLLPHLPDSLVRSHVWPVLVSHPSVSLVQLLRGVNSSWRRLLDTSVEWNTLRFLHLDSPGYVQYTTSNGQTIISSTERFLRELANFRVLMTEDMEELEYRVRYTSYRTLPIYVSASECPPTVEDCPGYYDL